MELIKKNLLELKSDFADGEKSAYEILIFAMLILFFVGENC